LSAEESSILSWYFLLFFSLLAWKPGSASEKEDNFSNLPDKTSFPLD